MMIQTMPILVNSEEQNEEATNSYRLLNDSKELLYKVSKLSALIKLFRLKNVGQ